MNWLGQRFLGAGASTFVGTSIPVYSRPARRFAALFYGALATGRGEPALDDARRDAQLVDRRRVEPGDLLGHEDALLEAAVRQLQTGHDVADREDARDVGPAGGGLHRNVAVVEPQPPVSNIAMMTRPVG